LIGLVRLRQGDVAGGCAAMQAALLRVTPASERYVDVLGALGHCELARGDATAALVRFEQAANAAPRMDAPIIGAVHALELAGRGEEAVERLRRYLRTNPDSAAGWRLLADRLTIRGAVDEARTAKARAQALGGYDAAAGGAALTPAGRD
jgi:predicted Zn-dependent protease